MRATNRRNVILAGVWAIVSAVAGSACGGEGDTVSMRPVEPGPVCPSGGMELIINDESHITCEDAQDVTIVKVEAGEDGNPCLQSALKVTISEPGKDNLISWVCEELRGDALPSGIKEIWVALLSTVEAQSRWTEYNGKCEAHLADAPWTDPHTSEKIEQIGHILNTCYLPYFAFSEELSGNALKKVECMIEPTMANASCYLQAIDKLNPQADACDTAWSTEVTNCISGLQADPACSTLTLSDEDNAAFVRFQSFTQLVGESCPDLSTLLDF